MPASHRKASIESDDHTKHQSRPRHIRFTAAAGCSSVLIP
jgi:hypothetical protein